MRILIVIILLIQNAFALEAVVTVLETPLFSAKDLDSPVVQYLRKGDVIKIHPGINNSEKFDHMAPPPEKMAKLKQNEMKDWHQDALFEKTEATPHSSDEFIPTLDRQGHVTYVLRDHLYIYFENDREFSQPVLSKDPTDYRLEEPLPKKYPLTTPTGYRGQFLLGTTQPYFESYPYPVKVKTKGYMSPLDVNVTLLRVTHHHADDRFFFGGTFNVKSFSNQYSLFGGRFSDEKGFKMGIGPYITYDAFKGLKNRVAMYGSVNVNIFNQLLITQSSSTASDQRTYRTINVAPRLGIQYHRKKIFEDIDFVIGSAMEYEPPTTYRAKNGATQAWWQHSGEDKFTTRHVFGLTGYIGLQSAY